jgi:hypothetical protein
MLSIDTSRLLINDPEYASIDVEELTTWNKFKNDVFRSLYDCDITSNTVSARQFFEEEIRYYTNQLIYDIYLPRTGLRIRSLVYRETLRSTLGYTSDVQFYIEQVIAEFTNEWKRVNNDIDIIYNELAVLENHEREIKRMLSIKKQHNISQCKCCETYNVEKLYVVRRRIDEINEFVIPGLSPLPYKRK